MISIRELMSTQLYTVNEHATVHDAHQIMREHKIRHVPVVNEHQVFVGLLTQHDLLTAAVSSFADVTDSEREELESGIPVAEIMVRDIIVANEETNLMEAARFMVETKHGCLPVVDIDNTLLGILTEEDFVQLAIKLLEKLENIEAQSATPIQPIL
ncbi:CBS domain-containing protein [Candidatus Venteria ishoeyi]|uniref:CBS domain-containing protein n=1 Tax=Candidatus Venteria ishoeyi TaxID=1899563 RepID=UPI0025A6595A|nr:CBS domain-containing protein [Candidatus Venteria ishoeyi]MDM8547596.1 CBS domain-containing protein [Candidatus Venteria ishoeyi]